MGICSKLYAEKKKSFILQPADLRCKQMFSFQELPGDANFVGFDQQFVYPNQLTLPAFW